MGGEGSLVGRRRMLAQLPMAGHVRWVVGAGVWPWAGTNLGWAALFKWARPDNSFPIISNKF
jgi:hypothetical protein